MSNETLENAKAKGSKWLKRARFLSMAVTIPAVLMAGMFFGVTQHAFYSVTTMIAGTEVAAVTNTPKLKAYRFNTCEATANDSCNLLENIIGDSTLVEDPAISVTWSSGKNETLYNVDFFQFYKPDSNTVAADADALKRQGSRGDNDKAVIIPTGVRIPLFNRMMEGGINRSVIRLSEYVTEAEYAELSSERQAQVITGKVGHFSFPAAVWTGIAWGMLWFAQLFFMCIPFVQFAVGRKANWGMLLGPVGGAVFWIVKRYRKNRSNAAA
ncbi:MAG: hypothetical protein OSB62_04265 [Alphaproteobacteria bacterium]|nr:hypothetical protein [Alphaproteobacteria bacterium]